MEKYGVDEQDSQEKVATDANQCPECGSLLDSVDNTGVLKCRNCGTKPFERK